MPKGEIEIHPYLSKGQIIGATKLILGSFPVYECTDQDNDLKKQNRQREGTIRFFYGSNRNSLWGKYSQYIDNTIVQPWNSELIIQSLTERRIAITDTIVSCERYKNEIDKKTNEIKLNHFSSEDNALKNKTWNREMIKNLIKNGVTKIICTSKGVLNDLEKQIICQGKTPFGTKDARLSLQFQSHFIENIGGRNIIIKNEIAKIFIVGSSQIIGLAIPSPGSPQRKIKEFGCTNQDKVAYAHSYFESAFNWLNE